MEQFSPFKADTGLVFWGWMLAGVAVYLFGSYKNFPAVRALGVGGVFAGAALWGLGQVAPIEQFAIWIGMSALSWFGGRRIARREAAAPNTPRAGLGLVGRSGTVARAFRNGHGTVALMGEVYAAVADDDLAEGAVVRVVGVDDEALKVEAKPAP